MANSWQSEIETRAALVCKTVVDSLSADATALFHKNSARGMLRSGGTFRAAYDLTIAAARTFYQDIDTYLRGLAIPPQTSLDTQVLQAVSLPSQELTQALHKTLRKAADMAGQPPLFERFLPDHQKDLEHARELFASNIRAYALQTASASSPTTATIAPTAAAIKPTFFARIALGIEIICFLAALAFIVLWLKEPQGPYEPWIALFAVPGFAFELLRRYLSTASGLSSQAAGDFWQHRWQLAAATFAVVSVISIFVYQDVVRQIMAWVGTSTPAVTEVQTRISIPIRIESSWDLATGLDRRAEFYISRPRVTGTTEVVMSGNAMVNIPAGGMTFNKDISVPAFDREFRTTVSLPQSTKLALFLASGGYELRLVVFNRYGHTFTHSESVLFERDVIKNEIVYGFGFIPEQVP